jgi:hypothetical protein
MLRFDILRLSLSRLRVPTYENVHLTRNALEQIKCKLPDSVHQSFEERASACVQGLFLHVKSYSSNDISAMLELLSTEPRETHLQS